MLDVDLSLFISLLHRGREGRSGCGVSVDILFYVPVPGSPSTKNSVQDNLPAGVGKVAVP